MTNRTWFLYRLLLIRFSMCLILLALLNQLVISFLPTTWGNLEADYKYQYFLSHADQYNAIFIGSSRTLGQVNPNLFDETVDTSLGIQSFNLGVGGLFFPESETIFRDLLAKKPPKLRYVFFELAPAPAVLTENLHTTRHVYWYNLKNIDVLISNTLETAPGMASATKANIQHFVSLIERSFNIGMGLDVLRYLTNPYKGVDEKNLLGVNADGFSPFTMANTGLTKARQAFIDDPDLVEQFSKYILDQMASDTVLQETYAALIQDMIKAAEEQNVVLIFIVPPRYYSSLSRTLEPSRKIEITDPEQYPELYDVQVTWDVSHLNESGAVIYTQILARKASELLVAVSAN